MLNLDTHVLLHAVAGRLLPTESRLLRNNRWGISAIVLWEIAKLAQLGRIAIDLEDVEVVRTLARVTVWPVTREIAQASTRLDILPSGVLTGTLKAGSFSAADGSSVKGEIWLGRAEPARVSDQGLDDDETPR